MTKPQFEDYSFWDRLGKDRPVILYGTGNGADKIIDTLERYDIRFDGIFASDGFVRNRSFRGVRVSSYSEIINIFGQDITVLLSFGTDRPEVLDFISELDKKHELIIPEVPLYGGVLFDIEYFHRNEEKIRNTISLFEDDYSKKLFTDAVNFRLTGKLKYLALCESFEHSVRELSGHCEVKVIVDGGAFTGDSARLFLTVFPDADLLLAAEPDPTSFSKLISSTTDKRIVPINAALSSSNGETSFSASSSKGSGITGNAKRSRQITVNEKTIDTLLSERKCDLLKLDVEGNEREALVGAEYTVKRYNPCLIISLYHRTDDLFDIPRMIKDYSPEYSLFLRRPFCVPMWDLNLFAVKKRKEKC